ncbi:pyridoxal phosphate-dependent aminotransferase [Xylophilus rhododendri]|nr:pyridoxal phosphate-dependent aminotransferase [Xylophilus rhododendri]
MAGVRTRKLIAEGRDIVALTNGEPDFATPPNILEAASRAMAAGRTKYTDVGGTPELREAVRHKFSRENGLSYRQDEVVVGTGGKQVVFNALMCTVEAGCEVIIPAPYWVSYPDIVLLAGGKPVFVDCPEARGFKLQPEDLERAITPSTRWLILNAPNNPSGAIYRREELRALADVLLRHPHVWVLTDDMYEHVIYDGLAFHTIAQVEPALQERTLTVNGVSKAYAMTGWRIGYGGGPAPLIAQMVKMQSHSTSNPSSVGQAAAVEALLGPQDFIAERCAIFQARRDFVVAQLRACPGLDSHLPEGAFYAFPSCAELIGRKTPQGRTIASDSDLVMYLLDEVNLAVLQGAAYGSSPYFRLSYASSMPELEEGARRLRLACERLQD